MPRGDQGLLIRAIQSELHRVAGKWAKPRSAGLHRYVSSWYADSQPPPGQREKQGQELVWLSLPLWMWGSYRRRGLRPRVHRGFLRDVLWGQFSLFLALKIQDDFFDGQLADRSLLWTSDMFLLESRHAFAVHFGVQDSFWKFYDRSITTTIDAIAEVDRRQSVGKARYRSISVLYPSMYRLCGIAAGAVCRAVGRDADYPRVSAFLDELMLAGQLLDDLEDITEDLDRGRVNAAAAFLVPRLRHASQRDSNRGTRRLGTAMLESDALGRFFTMIRRHVRQAADSIRFLRSPAASGFLRAYTTSLREYKAYYMDIRHRWGCVRSS